MSPTSGARLYRLRTVTTVVLNLETSESSLRLNSYNFENSVRQSSSFRKPQTENPIKMRYADLDGLEKSLRQIHVWYLLVQIMLE